MVGDDGPCALCSSPPRSRALDHLRRRAARVVRHRASVRDLSTAIRYTRAERWALDLRALYAMGDDAKRNMALKAIIVASVMLMLTALLVRRSVILSLAYQAACAASMM